MPRRLVRFRTAIMSAASAGLVACLVAASGASAQVIGSSTVDSVSTSPSEVDGCAVFPANNYWNTPVTHLEVHPRSEAWMSHMSPGSNLHPDFGKSFGEQPVPYGIPITSSTAVTPRWR